MFLQAAPNILFGVQLEATTMVTQGGAKHYQNLAVVKGESLN